MALEVTVVGSGRIGITLARSFRNAGVDVTLGGRGTGVGSFEGFPRRPVVEALTGAQTAGP